MAKHAPTPAPLVAYYRVSTARQGLSGLGLEAQRAAVAAHVVQTRATLLAEFTEVESGRKSHRPELARALVEARACGAVLVIAKFDRLARNVAFLSALMNGDVEFRALDLPGASRFHLHIMAAVAEKEATDASERTKVALAAARVRGKRLGTPTNLTDLSRRRSLAARRARAADRHRLTLPLVHAWQQLGWSMQRMADALTELRVPLPRAPRHGRPARPWQYVQVHRLVALARREGAGSISPPPVATAPLDPPVMALRVPAARHQPRRYRRIGRADPMPAAQTKPTKPKRTPEEREAAQAVKATKALARAERAARVAAKRKASVDAKATYDALPEAERRAQDARLAELLENAEWRFAKTMAHNPHHYTLRKTWTRDEDFVWCVERIRTLGYRVKFQGHWYTQLDVNDHFYWTMGWPIGSLDWGWDRLNVAGTILINRKPFAGAESARDSDSGQAVE